MKGNSDIERVLDNDEEKLSIFNTYYAEESCTYVRKTLLCLLIKKRDVLISKMTKSEMVSSPSWGTESAALAGELRALNTLITYLNLDGENSV